MIVEAARTGLEQHRNTNSTEIPTALPITEMLDVFIFA